MNLEADVEECQLKKESREMRETVRRILNAPDVIEYPIDLCEYCTGYNFECPEYSPKESTP